MLTPISGESEELYEGSRWVFTVHVSDDGGSSVGVVPTAAVLLPGGGSETAVVEDLGNGFYRAGFTVTDPGTYVATVSAAGYGVAVFSAYVESLTDPLASVPDLAAVKLYLGPTSTPDADITDALEAEEVAQRDVCRIPAVYPATLGQALKRRVARNLALREMPLAVLQGDAESGNLTLPGRDPEVRRLEAPYRKLVMP